MVFVQDTRVACGMCGGGCRTSVLASGVGITELTSMLQVAAATPPPTPFWNSPQVQGAFIALSGVLLTAWINAVQKARDLRHSKQESDVKRKYESANSYLKVFSGIANDIYEVEMLLKEYRRYTNQIKQHIALLKSAGDNTNVIRHVYEQHSASITLLSSMNSENPVASKIDNITKKINSELAYTLYIFPDADRVNKFALELNYLLFEIKYRHELTQYSIKSLANSSFTIDLLVSYPEISSDYQELLGNLNEHIDALNDDTTKLSIMMKDNRRDLIKTITEYLKAQEANDGK